MTHQPKPADFFLAPISGRVGAGIRFGQFLNGEGFGKYQHAGILLENGETIEAMPGGAIIGHIDHWKPEELRWSTGLIELTDAQRNDILYYGRQRKGVPYSFVDYLALAERRFQLRTPWARRYIDQSGHQICSQLVDWVYKKAGVHLFNDGRWEGYVTPASLDMLLDDLTAYKMSQGI